jgi:Rrf2 family protein
MLRTKASTYAILAVAEIAKRQKTQFSDVRAGEIARCLRLPGAYAAKVLTQLARAEVLHSDRGPRGGFRLSRRPEDVELLEIVEAVDGPIAAEVDVAELGEDVGTRRAVDQLFDGVAGQVRTLLGQRTVADLLKAQSDFARTATKHT